MFGGLQSHEFIPGCIVAGVVAALLFPVVNSPSPTQIISTLWFALCRTGPGSRIGRDQAPSAIQGDAGLCRVIQAFFGCS